MQASLTVASNPCRWARAGANEVLALFESLEQNCGAYCVLAGYDTLPDEPLSDIDFMVSTEDFKTLPGVIAATARRSNLRFVQFLRHETSACCYVLAWLEENCVTVLQADSAADFRRHGRIWMLAEDVLARRRKHPRGFWIPAPADAFLYYLVKRIDKQSLLPDHGDYLSRLYHEDPPGCDLLLARFWPLESALRLSQAACGCKWNEVIHGTGQFAADLIHHPKVYKDTFYSLEELARWASRIFHPTGLLVTCLGPDGVGKSSLAAGIQSTLRQCFRRTHFFHLRPGLLRSSAAGREFTAQPHGKPARSYCGSIAKLLFLLSDYWLGYWTRVRPLLVHSSLVVFDRYFDDVIADPRRFRVQKLTWLTKFISRIIPDPDIVLVLDAPPETVHHRKQELNVSEIGRQREAYLAIAQKSGGRFVRVIDGSQQLDCVIAQSCAAVLEYMEMRTARRLHLNHNV
jgi:thymidylate kinase